MRMDMKKTRMYGYLILLMMIILFTGTGISEVIGEKRLIDLEPGLEHRENNLAGQALPGSHYLKKRVKDLMSDYQDADQYSARMRMNKKTAWNFQVGDTKEWYAYSWVSGNDYIVPSTCRAVGTNCYVFVEDARWETPGDYMIQQKHVDSLVTYFDSKTPRNSEKGIYSTVTGNFGTPPDSDSDARIIILLLDIKDGYDPDGEAGFIAGYFDPANQFPKSQYNTSNEAEMFYMDTNPIDYDSYHMMYSALSTLAHEFQHMVHFNYDWDELDFVNEGCSEVSEVVCGFPVRSPGRYFNDTDKYLFDWDDEDDGTHLDDYSRAALWTTYLYDQMPDGFLKNLVQETTVGAYGVENAIKTSLPQTTRLVPEIFNDWILANLINDVNINPVYGYITEGIEGKPGFSHEYYTPNIGPVEERVSSYAVDYVKYTGLNDLSITFGGSEWVNIMAVKVGSTVELDHIVPGETWSIPDFNTNWDEVYFVISNTKNIPHTYNFTSTGETGVTNLELAYDDSEPMGYYNWDADDSVAVWFNGVPESMIDSIRVGFRHAGTAVFKISEYDGYSQQKVSGKTLKDSIVFNVTTEPELVNPGGYPPYAVPFTNWYTYDLTTDSVSGGNDFIVSYKVGAEVTEPHVLVSRDPVSGAVHSYIFTESNLGNRMWFPMDWVADDSVGNFMIRAYVSIEDPTADVDQGFALLPEGYNLSQNYPNPFNPATSINFTIPEESVVRINVYDLRGAFIREIAGGSFRNGTHTAKWDGTDRFGRNVSSGVYLVVMEAGDNRLTRKMVLLR